MSMNDRINELIEQCSFTVTEYSMGIDSSYEDFDKEKFAELIVRECMEMATELEARYLASRKSTMDFDEKNIYAEGEAACDILRFKMKQYFGVEE